jgi:hypothetical protein
MAGQQKLKHELKAVGVATLFFGVWIGALILLKTLVLEEYQLGFSGWSKVLVGALILAKVVLILEHVSFGVRVHQQPAWVDVLLRTALYSFGVLVVMVLEKGLEGRHGHGGFTGAVLAEARGAKFPHVLVNTICLSGALFAYNVLAVVRRHLGEGGLRRLFLQPLPEASRASSDRHS